VLVSQTSTEGGASLDVAQSTVTTTTEAPVVPSVTQTAHEEWGSVSAPTASAAVAREVGASLPAVWPGRGMGRGFAKGGSKGGKAADESAPQGGVSSGRGGGRSDTAQETTRGADSSSGQDIVEDKEPIDQGPGPEVAGKLAVQVAGDTPRLGAGVMRRLGIASDVEKEQQPDAVFHASAVESAPSEHNPIPNPLPNAGNALLSLTATCSGQGSKKGRSRSHKARKASAAGAEVPQEAGGGVCEQARIRMSSMPSKPSLGSHQADPYTAALQAQLDLVASVQEKESSEAQASAPAPASDALATSSAPAVAAARGGLPVDEGPPAETPEAADDTLADVGDVNVAGVLDEACSLCGLLSPGATVLVGEAVWACNHVHSGTATSCALRALADSSPPTVALSLAHPWGGSQESLRCVVSGETNVHKLGVAPCRGAAGFVVISQVANPAAAGGGVKWRSSEWRPMVGGSTLLAALFLTAPTEEVELAAARIQAMSSTALVAAAALVPKIQSRYASAWLFVEHYGAVVARAAEDEKREFEAHTSRRFDVRVMWGMDGDRRRVASLSLPEARTRSLRVGRELVLACEKANLRVPPTYEAKGTICSLVAGKVRLTISELSGAFDAGALVSVREAWDGTGYVRMQAALRAFLVDEQAMSAEVRAHICGRPLRATLPRRLVLPDELERVCAELGVSVNSVQLEVIGTVLRRPFSLVQGPPGCGKTDIVSVLAAILTRCGRGQVMCCASSNVAVDNFTERIAELGVDVLRLVARDRPMGGNVPHSCTLEAHIARLATKEATAYREYAQLGKARKLLGAEEAHFNRLRTRVEQQAVRLARVVCCTCSLAGGAQLRGMRFSDVVIDEAAQTIEPETLIPLTKGCARAVLIGDHQQLGPVVKSRVAARAGLATSMFARLVAAGETVLMLEVQYRMHPDIASFASTQFYHGRLRDGVTAAERVGVSLLPGVREPLLWWDVVGVEASVPPSSSLRNEVEADAVLLLLGHLLTVGKVAAKDVCVIAAYEAQCTLLRGRVGAEVEVNTVDAFQGRQKEYVIVSTVRSNALQGGASVGFMKDQRRLVVASTRAKRGCAFVGNAATLAQVDVWRALHEHLRRRGALMEGSFEGFRAGRPHPSPPPSPATAGTTFGEPPLVEDLRVSVAPCDQTDGCGTAPSPVLMERQGDSPSKIHAPGFGRGLFSSLWGWGGVRQAFACLVEGTETSPLPVGNVWQQKPTPPPSPPACDIHEEFEHEIRELEALRARVKSVTAFYGESVSALFASDPSLLVVCGCNDDTGTAGTAVRSLGIPAVLVTSCDAGDARKWFQGCNEMGVEFDLPLPQVVVCNKTQPHILQQRINAAGKSRLLQVVHHRQGREQRPRKEVAFNLDTYAGEFGEALWEQIATVHGQYRTEAIPYALCVNAGTSGLMTRSACLVIPATSFGISSSASLAIFVPRRIGLSVDLELLAVQTEMQSILRRLGDAATLEESDTRRNHKRWYDLALGLSRENATGIPRTRSSFPTLALSWVAARLAHASLCQRVGFPAMAHHEVVADARLKEWRTHLLSRLRDGGVPLALPVRRVVVVMLSPEGKHVILRVHEASTFTQKPELPARYLAKTFDGETLTAAATRAVKDILPRGKVPFFCLFDGVRDDIVSAALFMPTAVFQVVLSSAQVTDMAARIHKSGMEWVHFADLARGYKQTTEEAFRHIRGVRLRMGFEDAAEKGAKLQVLLARAGEGSEQEEDDFLGYGDIPEPIDRLRGARSVEADVAWVPEQMGTLRSGSAAESNSLEGRQATVLEAAEEEAIEPVSEQVDKYLAACRKYLTGERLKTALKEKRAKEGDKVEDAAERQDAELTSKSGQVERVAVLVVLQGDKVLCRFSTDGTVAAFAETLMPLTGSEYKDWMVRHQNYLLDKQAALNRGGKKAEEQVLSNKTTMEQVYILEPLENASHALERALEPWFCDREVGVFVRAQLKAVTKADPQQALRFFSAVDEKGTSRKPGAPAKTSKYMVWTLVLPETTDLAVGPSDAAVFSIPAGGGYKRVFIPPSTQVRPQEIVSGGQHLPSAIQQVSDEGDSVWGAEALCTMNVEQFLSRLGRAQPRLAVAVRCALHVHVPSLNPVGVAEAFIAGAEHAFGVEVGLEAKDVPEEIRKSFGDGTLMRGFVDTLVADSYANEHFYEKAADYSKKVYCLLRVGADVYYYLQRGLKMVETRLYRGLHRFVRAGDLLAFVAEDGEPTLWFEVRRVWYTRSYAEAVRTYGDNIYPDVEAMSPAEIDELFFSMHDRSMNRAEWESFFRKPGRRVACWELKPLPEDCLKPSGEMDKSHVESVNRITRRKQEEKVQEGGVYQPGEGGYRLARLTRLLLEGASSQPIEQATLCLQRGIRCYLARRKRFSRRQWVWMGLKLLRSLRRRRWWQQEGFLDKVRLALARFTRNITTMQSLARRRLAVRRCLRLRAPIDSVQLPPVEDKGESSGHEIKGS
jgi:regulator of nonsense transcripts 1